MIENPSDEIRENAVDGEEIATDPFHPDNVGTLNFIMLARIYDLMLLDLEARNPEAAKRVLEIHSRGALLGVPPELNGEFLSDNP